MNPADTLGLYSRVGAVMNVAVANTASTSIARVAEDAARELISVSHWGHSSFVNLPLIYPDGSHVTVKLDPVRHDPTQDDRTARAATSTRRARNLRRCSSPRRAVPERLDTLNAIRRRRQAPRPSAIAQTRRKQRFSANHGALTHPRRTPPTYPLTHNKRP